MDLNEIPEKIFARSGIAKLHAYLITRHQKDIVFIWIPKTAGTSVLNAFEKCGCRKLKSLRSVRYYFPQRGFVTFGHMSYQQLKEKGYLSHHFHQHAFKFCFVRNPWERLVSLFFYLKKTNFIHENKTFKTFLYEIQDRAMPPIGLYNSKALSQCNPQVDWVLDADGKLIVDFIGRYEHLEKDFNDVCQQIGCEVVLPVLNITPHKHYAEYYDDEGRKIVEKVYAADIDYFGYRFDN